MDFTGVTTFCFVASYGMALAFEAAALAGRMRGRVGEVIGGGRRLVALGFVLAGLVAQAIFLVLRAREQATPLSSPADWCLIAALLLALLYLGATLASPRWALGVFLLPVVLLLIGVAGTASEEPFAPQRASLFWGQLHGWLLLLAAVTICIGFVAGLMYLVQSWRLKNKLPPHSGFGLPSLERLERVNSTALDVSVVLVAGGFVSGLVLSSLKHSGDDHYVLWADPVVVALAALLLWLLVAAAFRAVYPPARVGRKVAYLTVASFAFLVMTIASMTLFGAAHGTAPPAPDAAALNEHSSATTPRARRPVSRFR